MIRTIADRETQKIYDGIVFRFERCDAYDVKITDYH